MKPLQLPDSRWNERWLYFAHDDGDYLHRVSTMEWSEQDNRQGTGSACCGATGSIERPGFQGRIYAPRCPACCRIVGIPEGGGAPYNHGIQETP